MLGTAKKTPDRLEAVERVEQWTRERFGVQGGQVHVWEIECAVPGCPPVETAVLFWISDQRYQFKVFKPLDQVGGEDLPPAWFRNALAFAYAFECGCC